MLFMHGECSKKGSIIIMKNNNLAAVTAGLIGAGLAAVGIGLAAPALADNGGTVALPGPVPVYAQDSFLGGANPYVPFGTNPMVPYGTWAQH